jgi:exodeoxyribonuclease VII small subunit
MKEENISFEAAYQRLEEILEKLNSATVSLDDSLKLYEEADKLIALCNKKLIHAERKIETLVKNREGRIATDETGAPLKEPFHALTSEDACQTPF